MTRPARAIRVSRSCSRNIVRPAVPLVLDTTEHRLGQEGTRAASARVVARREAREARVRAGGGAAGGPPGSPPRAGGPPATAPPPTRPPRAVGATGPREQYFSSLLVAFRC